MAYVITMDSHHTLTDDIINTKCLHTTDAYQPWLEKVNACAKVLSTLTVNRVLQLEKQHLPQLFPTADELKNKTKRNRPKPTLKISSVHRRLEAIKAFI